MVLPPSVFDAARVDLADLRLYDARLRDLPYALRVRSEVDTTEAVPAKEFNRVPASASSGSSQLSLDLGEKQIEHNEVEINTPGDDFRRRVLLEGSDDGNTWNKLVEHDIVRFPSGEKSFVDRTLGYTPSRYRYLRITLHRDPQNDTRAVDVGEVVVRRRVKVPGELDERQVPFGQREPVRADGGPGSRWVVDLQGTGIPVDRLLVRIADEAFVRNYYIEAGGPAGTNERFWRVTSGVWQRRAGEPKQDLVAEFGQEHRAARLRLVVTDNRNPALNLESVRAAAPARVVIARRTDSPDGPWRLYFGNPKAESPNYDFARNLPQMEDWVARAREVAAVLCRIPGVRVQPDPPQVNFFQLFIEGDHEALSARHLALAKETGTFLFHRLGPSPIPGIAMTEMHMFGNAMRFDMARLSPFMQRLLATA